MYTILVIFSWTIVIPNYSSFLLIHLFPFIPQFNYEILYNHYRFSCHQFQILFLLSFMYLILVPLVLLGDYLIYYFQLIDLIRNVNWNQCFLILPRHILNFHFLIAIYLFEIGLMVVNFLLRLLGLSYLLFPVWLLSLGYLLSPERWYWRQLSSIDLHIVSFASGLLLE